jgi:hypothetical protein
MELYQTLGSIEAFKKYCHGVSVSEAPASVKLDLLRMAISSLNSLQKTSSCTIGVRLNHTSSETGEL